MVVEKTAEDAYDLWAETYDNQPGNLMIDLDEVIFSTLLSEVSVSGKKVADIGCGTGRHWEKIFLQQPALLKGFDVSEGMLKKLKRKFSGSSVKKVTDNQFVDEADEYFDIIVSTLTIAHIENMGEAVCSWSRMLKNGGEMIITDYHPALLNDGGKRTFRHDQQSLAIKNFVHSLEYLEKMFHQNDLVLISKIEKRIDDSMKHYYVRQNALPTFEKFKGKPVVYGMHLKKNDTQ